MALGIYLGGTTGLADGTLEVPSDGSGLTLGAIGSVGTLHIRASSGKQNAEQVTVNAPTNCEVSTDGVTYGATAVYAIGVIQDVNVAIYVKRTAGTNALTTGGTTTPRLSLITEEAIPVPDTTAPVLGGTLTATPGDTQVTLSGPTAYDAVGIAKWQYRIGTGAWVDIANSANTTMPSTVVGSLTNGVEYSFTVRALDAIPNASAASAAATATPADTTAPTIAGSLTATAGSGQVVLDWADGVDNHAVTGYDVEYGTTTGYGSAVSPDPTASTTTVTGLTNGTLYYFRVRAYDAAGNTSAWLTASATPAAGADITAPAIAGTLSATPTAVQGQVTLSGPTATDAVGIAKWQYQVDAGAWVDVASTSGAFPSTNVSSLSIASHNFAVRALDAAGNASDTKTASATVADITAPVLSGTLSAVAGDGQVTLSGPTATDAVGIAKWQYRNYSNAWVDIASSASGTMPSTVVGGLVNGTVYSFTVRALDAAANASDASNAATATPADTTAPVLSGTLVATAGDGEVVLDWPDATDAVGVTGYDVEYGTSTAYGSTIADPTTSTATITGLTNGTLYYFRVRAHDSAGNLSQWISSDATPGFSDFVNDFAAGQSLSPMIELTNTGESGNAVGVANNMLTLTRGATGGTVGWRCLRPISKTDNTRMKIRLKRRSGSTLVSNGHYLFSLFHSPDGLPISALRNVFLNGQDDIRTFRLYYSVAAMNSWYSWRFDTGAFVGFLQGGGQVTDDDTYYEVWIEMEYNTGSPRLRYIFKDASGTTVTNGTTAWVPFSSIADWGSTTDLFYLYAAHNSESIYDISKIAVETY